MGEDSQVHNMREWGKVRADLGNCLNSLTDRIHSYQYKETQSQIDYLSGGSLSRYIDIRAGMRTKLDDLYTELRGLLDAEADAFVTYLGFEPSDQEDDHWDKEAERDAELARNL